MYHLHSKCDFYHTLWFLVFTKTNRNKIFLAICNFLSSLTTFFLRIICS